MLEVKTLKRYFVILISFILVPSAALAADNSLFDTGPKPTQSYHQASSLDAKPTSKKSAAAVSAESVSDAKAMAQVKEIMQAAKEKVQNQGKVTDLNKKKITPNNQSFAQPLTTQSIPQKQPSFQVTHDQPLTMSSELKNPNAMGLNSAQGLESQIAQLNQNNLFFQQKVDREIELLTNKNKALSDQLNNLDKVLRLLNQEIDQMKGSTTHSLNAPQYQLAGQIHGSNVDFQTTATAQGSWLDKINIDLKGDFKYLIVIFILLLILITLLIPRRDNKRVTQAAMSNGEKADPNTQSQSSDDDDTKDEYDFMGSSEGIPAKLDLARAYLAMEDYQSARTVLEQVKAEGNEAQRQEAKELANQINNNS